MIGSVTTTQLANKLCMLPADIKIMIDNRYRRLHLDDGFVGDMSVELELSRILSDSVRQDLASSGFTANDDKSIWEPTQKLVFLGSILDFGEVLIRIPEFRILKLKSSLVSCLQNNQILARDLASVTGIIISMACAVGNVTRLFTRNCYAAIECRSSWDQPLHVSPEVCYELSFWLNNIDSINVKVMSPKSSAVDVVYSDASDSGFDDRCKTLHRLLLLSTCPA